MLNKRKEKEYVASGGGECPGCGSNKITAGNMEMDGTQAYTQVVCNECDATWQDIYRLVSIDKF